MYYGVIGRSMEIAITDVLEVGQLVISRRYEEATLFSGRGVGRRGLVIEIRKVVSVTEGTVQKAQGHVVRILWQDNGEIEKMPDWYAAELLDPMPS